eukprot:CAMPEP_0180683342 /NCGR_PEP_ID=MMETSP1037_2-20121125/71080_1 /TAXON_ID=632150 /ORGANISM="Azadinium spinosum, Strain 3D9" /LENGTH=131 /DNA_ID=CAMNT_0022713477 /DNA_START=229 /DNA_END=621 /DNA_ORIENTATION=+
MAAFNFPDGVRRAESGCTGEFGEERGSHWGRAPGLDANSSQLRMVRFNSSFAKDYPFGNSSAYPLKFRMMQRASGITWEGILNYSISFNGSVLAHSVLGTGVLGAYTHNLTVPIAIKYMEYFNVTSYSAPS